MPYSRILIHFVWSTKNRYPYITMDNRPIIQQHIISNATKKDIFIVAMSVSEGGRKSVINYIKNQDDHHQGKTFQREYEEFMEVIGSDLLG